MRSTMNKMAVLAIAVAAGVATQTASAHDIHYQGSATGVRGELTIRDISKRVKIGEVLMACSGTAREQTVLASSVRTVGLTVDTIHVHTIGRDNVAESDATIQQIRFNPSSSLDIIARGLTSHAQATCHEESRTVSVSGGSAVAYLSINGKEQRLAEGDSDEERRVFEIPNVGRVIVNDRWVSSSGKHIITYAMRVELDGAQSPAQGEIYFAKSNAKVTCSNTTPQTAP